MKLAQLEIKATVTVNTSDLGNRKRDDDSQDKDVPVRKKGQRSHTVVWIYEFKSGCHQHRMLRWSTIISQVNFVYMAFNSFPFACLCLARDSAVVMTEDVKEQLLEASTATKKAFNSYRREADPDDHFNSADGQHSTGDKNQDEGEMSFVIVIMQPILRFLQLLCENHNRDLQVGQTPFQSDIH